MSIYKNYTKIRSEIPEYVVIIPASKTRMHREILELINAGCKDIGENYVLEAREKYIALGEYAKKLRWHLIGHLQGNKVKSALEIFDVIQTVDSIRLAKSINNFAKKPITIFVEVNIGCEKTKSGVSPGEVKNLIIEISQYDNLRIEGLMTIEPHTTDPQIYFKNMKILYDEIKKLKIPKVNMKTLSMGMSNSYNEAIPEGSNMVRIGTKIFGKRK